MHKLQIARDSIKGSVISFGAFLDTFKDKSSFDSGDVFHIEYRYNAILPALDAFNLKHQEVLNLIPDNENLGQTFKEEEAKKTEFENAYFSSVSRAANLLSSNSSSEITRPKSSASFMNDLSIHVGVPQHNPSANDDRTPNNSFASSSGSMQIQLPKISLPSFSGVHDMWLEFRDKYTSLLHERTDVDDIEKFHYLRACLTGDAAAVIAGVQFCAANYSEAWSILCSRYDNSRVLIHNHIKSLFLVEPIQRESATKLRSLIDSLSKHVGALKRLKDSGTDLSDILLTYLITSKFDPITAREWEESHNQIMSIDTLKKFIQQKADLLETIEAKQHTDKSRDRLSVRAKNTNTHVVNNNINQMKCPVCKQNHMIRNCQTFLNLDPSARFNKIRSLNRCINCFRFGHQAKTCSSGTCCKCGRQHHTLLHFSTLDQSSVGQSADEISPIVNRENDTELVATTSTATALNPYSAPSSCILLSTALVRISSSKRSVNARVLLDSGSQSSFMSESLAKTLGCSLTPVNISVSGFSLTSSSISHACNANVESIHGNCHITTQFFVVPVITGLIPEVRIDTNSFVIPKNVALADPSFSTPGPIDLLLGAEHFYSLLCVGQISLGPGKPLLQKSKLGWLISGMAAGLTHVSSLHVQQQSPDLTSFWELEEIPAPVSPFERHPCEQHFQRTITRNFEGRFVVTIPTANLDQLGDTRELALKRFHNVERTLQRNPSLKELYIQFMNDYMTLGHMSLVANPNSSNRLSYFLPHHGVKKDSSSTTKLRVVFDGSAKPINGKSLNECQLVGPCVQDDLFSILIRFRTYPIVFSADVEKMYRQVLVDPSQRNLQQIFWRSEPTEPVQVFELNTITYGTASSSYLATRCLLEISKLVENDQPSVAHRIKHDFYVDDLLSGADTVEEAVQLITCINSTLHKFGLPLRKWTSNCKKVLDKIQSLGTGDIEFALTNESSSSTLGLMWDSQLDVLRYKIELKRSTSVTKRSILSAISSIFDPLGLLSACVIVAKIIIQRLWSLRLDWDHSLPIDIHHEWVNLRDSLHVLNSLSIPRFVLTNSYLNIEIHGFSDASITAYGATIYVRCTNNLGKVNTMLICAKGKVAPLKSVTLPRLELCGAHLLARLYKAMRKSIQLPISSVTLWCDNTSVLKWLRQCPSNLRTFVGNRVAQIQVHTDKATWRYVPTDDNPADLVSRGCTPSQLINSRLWWRGPSWLAESSEFWPQDLSLDLEPTLELRPNTVITCVVTSSVHNIIDVNKFSSFSQLIHVVTYMLRFVYNARYRPKRTSFITFAERNAALKLLIKCEQQIHFATEISSLSRKEGLSSRSKLLPLSPFLDEDGIIRVGGRLKQSNLSFDQIHPILLANSHFSKLIFRAEHLQLLHIGPNGLLSSVRQRYWCLSGRNIARKIVRECITCVRANPKPFNPQMGQLPADRVNPSPPFHVCGVDYAGPITLKTLHSRGCKTYKGYIALFVCFTTKAVHLELVTDLTSSAFIAALRRFVSRRGLPHTINSDNATNFVGAKRGLNELARFLRANANDIKEKADAEGIVWRFIPPRSPHFGGLWESGIKSVKGHLKRIVGEQIFTFEDYYTFLTQIEAILNSRPLFPLSTDPNDLSCLTPAHFLIGRRLVGLIDKPHSDDALCSRYQHLQRMTQHFWTRWTREYLTGLQLKSKWRQEARTGNIAVGTLVLLVDDCMPSMRWRMGRIIATHPGDDGIIRVVTVRTASGEMKRAIRRLCPLPIQPSTGESATVEHPNSTTITTTATVQAPKH